LWRVPYSKNGHLTAKAAPGTHEAVESVLKDAGVEKNADILELASGTGYFLSRLNDLGYSNLTSVERDMSTYQYSEICPLRLDLNKPFSDKVGKKFDLIIAVEIIEHLNNPRIFLEEIYKSLKPGGRVIVTTPNVGFWLSRVQFLLTGYPKYFSPFDFSEQRHISPICDHHMKIALEETNFRLEKNFSAASSWGFLIKALTFPLSILFKMINRGSSDTEGNINLYMAIKI